MDENGPRQWGPGASKRSPESRSHNNTPNQAKKGRSEEREAKEEEVVPKSLDEDMKDQQGREIKDLIEDMHDLRDQMKASQNQLAFLLYHEVDRQRGETARKIMVKNWWQYVEVNDANAQILFHHREAMISWVAKQADKDIEKFSYDHRKGRNISPFSMIDAGSFADRQKIMEWFMQNGDKKGIAEWNNDKLQTFQSGNNRDGINGYIKFEPCISTFDRLQTEPLKAIMTVISKLTPGTQWKHSWKHLTIQEKDTENYLAWVAIDHLHGTAKIYVAKKLFSARQFEDEFQAAYSANMSRKVIGNKGKGKRSEQEGVLTPGDFLKAVGLGSEGKGSYLRMGTQALKTRAPFLFEVRAIAQEEFPTKYEEQLNKIAKRILEPDTVL